MKRQIITIDEQACTGCGACVPDCPEGALQIIDGKARLVGDLFCDGLGACIGACPENAITVEYRDAEPYNEELVMLEHILPKGRNTVKAHLNHLKEHGASAYLEAAERVLEEAAPELLEQLRAQEKSRQSPPLEEAVFSGCPALRSFSPQPEPPSAGPGGGFSSAPSELRSWPVQMHLLNPASPHFFGSDFLLAADCTAFAMGGFHGRYIKGRTVGVACVKLDSGLDDYRRKLVELIDSARIESITAAVMDVPCCSGLLALAAAAVREAERSVPIRYVQISSRGEILADRWIDPAQEQ
jgi:ferredoxin